MKSFNSRGQWHLAFRTAASRCQRPELPPHWEEREKAESANWLHHCGKLKAHIQEFVPACPYRLGQPRGSTPPGRCAEQRKESDSPGDGCFSGLGGNYFLSSFREGYMTFDGPGTLLTQP